MTSIILIAGLGNPGAKYKNNRHNAGFMALDALASHFGVNFSSTKGEAQTARIQKEASSENGTRNEILLMKPQAFMNLSGKPIAQAVKLYNIPPAKILILHDEIELPFSDVRLKIGGGHKGHNGLRDIISRCGFADFHRLRIGVGRPEHDDVAGYVLSDFTPNEKDELPAVMDACVKQCLNFIAKCV